MPIKLSVPERHILYIVLMNARASVPEIAQQIGCRTHVVQHALRKFRDTGLIARRVMIDIFRLGYARHDIYITLSSEGQHRKLEIAEFLATSSCTSAVLEVGGEYDFFVATITRTSAELVAFNRELSVRFGSLFLKKDVAVTVRHSVFGEKMLVSEPQHYKECFYEVDHSQTSEPMQLDNLDHQLLHALTGPDVISSRSVAQHLGVPTSTIDYRIKRFEAAGVICGHMHEIHGEMIGLTNYIVLVAMKGMSEERHREFHRFAKEHRNIAHLSFDVGHWDYMLGIAVEEQKDLNLVIELIRKAFGDAVASIKSFPMFHARKVRDYPIAPAVAKAKASKSTARH